MKLELKNEIIKKIEEIIEIDDNEWNKLDIIIKLKLIHNMCNYIDKKTNIEEYIKIPLKMTKPNKMIQYCGIDKRMIEYKEYNNKINKLNSYIREEYGKYHSYNNLSKRQYEDIIKTYNEIVYEIMDKKRMNIDMIVKELIGNREIIIYDENKSSIEKGENQIIIRAYNIVIKCELILMKTKICHKIPVIYRVILENYI